MQVHILEAENFQSLIEDLRGEYQRCKFTAKHSASSLIN